MHRQYWSGLAAFLLINSLAAPAARGQSRFDGRWEGETDGGASLVLEVVVKESVPTGTLTRNDERTEITEGKVARNTITFKATLNGSTEGLSGELAGDDLRLWLDRQGPSKAVVLKRAKAK